MIISGNEDRGRAAIGRYGCGSCHIIPGTDGALGKVGPDLAHVGQHAALAGSLGNETAAMTVWLLHPKR